MSKREEDESRERSPNFLGSGVYPFVWPLPWDLFGMLVATAIAPRIFRAHKHLRRRQGKYTWERYLHLHLTT